MLLLLIAGSIHAQQGELAQNSPNRLPVVRSGNARVDAVMRIASRTERQVVLAWAPIGEGVSHYVLERSGDGRNYVEAGVFFSGDGIDEPDYVFTDKLRRPYSGPLYYRLRVVGFNGIEAYTHPRVSELLSNNIITK